MYWLRERKASLVFQQLFFHLTKHTLVFAVHQLSELYFTFRTCLTPEFHWWRIGSKLIVCVRTQCTHTWSGTYWNGNYDTELCIFVPVRVEYVTSFQTWFLPLESNTPFWLRVKHLSMWQTIIYTLWGCVTWYKISTKASRTSSTSVSGKEKKIRMTFFSPVKNTLGNKEFHLALLRNAFRKNIFRKLTSLTISCTLVTVYSILNLTYFCRKIINNVLVVQKWSYFDQLERDCFPTASVFPLLRADYSSFLID